MKQLLRCRQTTQWEADQDKLSCWRDPNYAPYENRFWLDYWCTFLRRVRPGAEGSRRVPSPWRRGFCGATCSQNRG